MSRGRPPATDTRREGGSGRSREAERAVLDHAEKTKEAAQTVHDQVEKVAKLERLAKAVDPERERRFAAWIEEQKRSASNSNNERVTLIPTDPSGGPSAHPPGDPPPKSGGILARIRAQMVAEAA